MSRCSLRRPAVPGSVLRLQHRAFGVEVVPQRVVEDDRGFVARGDLWVVGTRTLQEYDGAVHLTASSHTAPGRMRLMRQWGMIPGQ